MHVINKEQKEQSDSDLNQFTVQQVINLRTWIFVAGYIVSLSDLEKVWLSVD